MMRAQYTPLNHRMRGLAGCPNSKTINLPPGFSTRKNSCKALAGSVTLRIPKAIDST